MCEAVAGLQADERVSGVLAAHEGGHGHAHIVINHAVGHAAHVVEVAAVRLQESLRVLMQKQVGHAVVAVGQREHGHVDLRPPAADGEVELTPVKLAVHSGLVHLADEALLRRRVCRPARVDVVTHRRIAHFVAEGTQCGVHVRRLHAQFTVAAAALLVVGGQITVDKLAHGLRQRRLLAQWGLVAGLAPEIGRKRLVPLGACRHVFIHIGLHRLAAHAQFPGHGTDRTRGLIHANDVLSLYHVKHSIKHFSC